MAKVQRVWGIDIGQSALKALHCVREGEQLTADAFDYVEYPKILSQPESDPEALVREAIAQFLSRNQITREDKVAISVPGQSGLAKFFKPPPVDVKKIPDIVRYEAKQQIPFPLDDVIWDFQRMVGGAEVDGFAVDTEVGLFAMKREQVYRYLKPFQHAEIELDVVQLSPLAIYNFIAFDVLNDGPPPDLFDPDDPPDSIVVLSMGTDATDLVITNGFRVWQRSIPLGGNHFTKQITREFKLTFAKAEHLKRNARQAEDPKAVFQAMRPVFNDMVTEIQRSIGYFQSIDRKAKIRGVVLLGNAVKLPGLQQYVAKNLGYEVIPFESFKLLSGPAVLSAPAFADNILTYGVCYGLCLQAGGLARLSTNLLPREIVTRRIIKAKKPWAVASVGALMLACALNFSFNYSVWSKVREDQWKSAEGKADSTKSQSGSFDTAFKAKQAQLKFIAGIGEEVVGASDRRLLWMELLKTVNAALPWTEGVDPGVYVDYKTLPMEKRKELHIEYVESEYFPDLTTWFTEPVKEKAFEQQRHLEWLEGGAAPAASPTPPSTDPAAAPLAGTPDASAPPASAPPAGAPPAGAPPASPPPADATAADTGTLDVPGPTGAGWVIELAGFHYFNPGDRRTSGASHVRNTLLRNLEKGSILLPVDNGTRMERFTLKELGISFPILAVDGGEARPVQVKNPDFEAEMGANAMANMGGMYGETGGSMMPGMGPMGGMAPPMGGMSPMGGMGAMGGPYGTAPGAAAAGKSKDGKELPEPTPPIFLVPKYTFVVQFCWQEKTISERLKAREELLKQQQAGAEATGGEQAPGTAPPAPADAVAPVPGSPAAPPPAGAPAAPTAPADPALNPAAPPASASAAPPPTGAAPGTTPPEAAPPVENPPPAIPPAAATPTNPPTG